MTKALKKVMLVDDHSIVREGFSRLIMENGENEVVAQVSSGKEAVEYARQHTVDVAEVDINMEDMDGLETTSRLLLIQSDIKVVILSVNEVEPFISKSFEAGASAFLSKRCAPEELLVAIQMVGNGEQYLSEHVYRKIALDKLNNKESLLSTLTKREFEVFQHLARGHTMIDIANRLHISPKTGYVFRGNILKKLSLLNLADLMKFAYRNNIT